MRAKLHINITPTRTINCVGKRNQVSLCYATIRIFLQYGSSNNCNAYWCKWSDIQTLKSTLNNSIKMANILC